MIIIDFEFLNCDKRDVNLDGTQLTNDYGRSTCDNDVSPLDGSMTQNFEENAAKNTNQRVTGSFIRGYLMLQNWRFQN